MVVSILKGKCWARLHGVGKGWSYYMIWCKGEIMDSWKISSQTDEDGDRIISENVCQKPAGNSRRLKTKSLQSLLSAGDNTHDWWCKMNCRTKYVISFMILDHQPSQTRRQNCADRYGVSECIGFNVPIDTEQFISEMSLSQFPGNQLHW